MKLSRAFRNEKAGSDEPAFSTEPVSTRYFGPDFLISLTRNCGVTVPR